MYIYCIKPVWYEILRSVVVIGCMVQPSAVYVPLGLKFLLKMRKLWLERRNLGSTGIRNYNVVTKVTNMSLSLRCECGSWLQQQLWAWVAASVTAFMQGALGKYCGNLTAGGIFWISVRRLCSCDVVVLLVKKPCLFQPSFLRRMYGKEWKF